MAGLVYALVYLGAITPGVVFGRRLAGAGIGGTLVGAVLGYALTQLALWVPFVTLFPLWFFRYSRSVWLALEYALNPEP